jgi:hypothetical protein
VLRVADEPAHPIAACGEQPREPPRDLPMSTSDDDVHGGIIAAPPLDFAPIVAGL